MQTEVQKIGERSLARAKELLLRGECVAFPTETVYGLGADARSDEAVERIYRVKGRPQDNPLIVHIHPGFDLGSLVYDEPYAQKLREAFLPGPLTLGASGGAALSPLRRHPRRGSVRQPLQARQPRFGAARSGRSERQDPFDLGRRPVFGRYREYCV